MKMTHEQQVAVLVCLYLQRAGACEYYNIVDGLMIRDGMLSVIFSLTESRIISCVLDGMTSAYTLIGDPTIGEILMVFEQPTKIRGFSVEARALRTFISNTNNALKPMLKRKISNINKELIANEVSMRDKASGIEN